MGFRLKTERGLICHVDGTDLFERPAEEHVHLLQRSTDMSCCACGHPVHMDDDWVAIWTDNPHAWDENPGRCNVAYKP